MSSESFSPLGNLIAAATVSAAGALLGENRGVLSITRPGGVPVGAYEVNLSPGSNVTRASATVIATVRSDAAAPTGGDSPNVRHVDVDTIEVRTFVGGVLTDRPFDIEVVRRAIGA